MSEIIVKFEDLGLIDYKEAWDYQEELFDAIIGFKSAKDTSITGKPDNFLLFCEHPHVLTLGKSGSKSNLLINSEELKKNNVSFYRINRGGDITYHGPGQIIGYPILDLEEFGMGVKQYIFSLEEAIIKTIDHYGMKGGRLKDAIGVWLDVEDPGQARKICAIGVRTSRYVSMHGFAFNVNTDLSYYRFINPCGFIDKGVTSMEKELGFKPDFNEVKMILSENMEEVFGMTLS